MFMEPLLCAKDGENTGPPVLGGNCSTQELRYLAPASGPVFTTGNTEGKQARRPCAQTTWPIQALAFSTGGSGDV